MQLNHDDIQLLLEACDSHERNFSSGALMGDMLSAMICRDEEQYKKMEATRAIERRAQEVKQRALKDTLIVLKAKLVTLRAGIEGETADRVLADAKQ